jgi:DnaJ-class molecular chaperone
VLNAPPTRFEPVVQLAAGNKYMPQLTRGQFLDAFTLHLPESPNSTGLTGKQRFTAALAVQIWGDNANKAVEELERAFADTNSQIKQGALSACRRTLGLPYWADVVVTLRLTKPAELHWYGRQTVECQKCDGTGDVREDGDSEYVECNHCDGEGHITEEEADFVTNWEGELI